jgi:DNA-binding LacI/PurR family transcriptional regulator
MTRKPAPPAGAVTIIDVAQAAGVSKTTASDALRGHGRVSPATREAVAAAAARLGFSINRSARSLRTATTGAIGLYIPQVLAHTEHYMSFIYGVVNEAAAFDYDVTLIVASGHAKPGYAPHVDGIVLIDPVAEDPMIQRLLDTGLPTVSSERLLGPRRTTGVVWSNHAQYFTRLLEHLAERGARHPALIASTTHSEWSFAVQQAYADWCRAAKVAPHQALAPFAAPPPRLQEIARAMVTDAPEIDAFIGAGDGVAAAVAQALASDGLRIGSRMLIASGVDSSATLAAQPPITAINTQGGEGGQLCARLLFDLLQGRAEPGVELELPLEIYYRASTAGGNISSRPGRKRGS